jgi:hypothetical protein
MKTKRKNIDFFYKEIKSDSAIGFIKQLLFNNSSELQIKEENCNKQRNSIVEILEDANKKLDDIYQKIMNNISSPKKTKYLEKEQNKRKRRKKSKNKSL